MRPSTLSHGYPAEATILLTEVLTETCTRLLHFLEIGLTSACNRENKSARIRLVQQQVKNPKRTGRWSSILGLSPYLFLTFDNRRKVWLFIGPQSNCAVRKTRRRWSLLPGGVRCVVLFDLLRYSIPRKFTLPVLLSMFAVTNVEHRKFECKHSQGSVRNTAFIWRLQTGR